MPIARRSLLRLLWIGQIAVVPVLAAVCFLPQSATSQASCPPSPDTDVPFGATIQAKVTGLLDSGQLKAGKGIWVTVVNGLVFPGCGLKTGSALYGHVTAAVAQKNPDASELSLVLDHADCEDHARKAMPLRLIGLVAPPDEGVKERDPVPGGLHGTRKSAPTAQVAIDSGDQLNPGGPPHTVHPGVVAGVPNIKLELQGGPACSARFSSSNRSLQLQPGSVLILVVQGAQ
jgi:hypothetical protein